MQITIMQNNKHAHAQLNLTHNTTSNGQRDERPAKGKPRKDAAWRGTW